jgi:hypothetical protein
MGGRADGWAGGLYVIQVCENISCYFGRQLTEIRIKEATQLKVKFILINLCNILHIRELSCDITKEL